MYVDYNFEARLSMKGKFKYLYDQAGLMLRLDEENWIKLGICHYRDQLYVSCVFTRGNSDWSTHRLPMTKIEWFHVWAKRRGEVVECYYSLDNENWIRIRQGYFTDAPRLRVGMMCAAPESAGFKVTFTNFLIKGGVDDEEEAVEEEEEEEEEDDFHDRYAMKNPALSLLAPEDGGTLGRNWEEEGSYQEEAEEDDDEEGEGD
jgi:regulation of enolase protein 1 (concanavalin A-like superfamily)